MRSGQADRHTEQCRVGEGVAKIGQAPPDDERTEGPGDQRHAESPQQGPQQKVIDHFWLPGCSLQSSWRWSLSCE